MTTDSTLRGDLIEAFNRYLHPSDRIVFGVPPDQDWDWDNHNDEAFSTYRMASYV